MIPIRSPFSFLCFCIVFFVFVFVFVFVFLFLFLFLFLFPEVNQREQQLIHQNKTTNDKITK